MSGKGEGVDLSYPSDGETVRLYWFCSECEDADRDCEFETKAVFRSTAWLEAAEPPT